MAYKELIKNFNRIRSYMREFYVYGFKKREEYTRKSPRSYDNERRRIESILGNYIQFHQTENGKNVFLSIDSRITEHNPLYQAWKIKSFTDGDITGNDILGAVSTALSAASYLFASAGFFPVAGVVGIAGCVVGLVSTMINLAGQSLLIQVPLEDGHNVYVYISPNMTSFA